MADRCRSQFGDFRRSDGRAGGVCVSVWRGAGEGRGARAVAAVVAVAAGGGVAGVAVVSHGGWCCGFAVLCNGRVGVSGWRMGEWENTSSGAELRGQALVL